MNLLIAGLDLASVFFLIAVLFAMMSSSGKGERKYVHFFISLVALIISTAFDGVAFFMDEFGGNEAMHVASNLISYIGVDVVFPAFVFFVSEKIRERGTFSVMHSILVLVASIVDLCILSVGASTGALFRIVDGTTVYGPLNNFAGIIQFVMCMYFIVQIIVNRKALDKKTAFTVSLYFILPVLSLVVEFIDSNITFAYFATSVAYVIIYIAIVQEDLQAKDLGEKIMYTASVTDNLTGLLNRRAYSDDVAKIGDDFPDDFIYISLDVNGLKIVNDTIGHAAGDEIIAGAAGCMKRCFGSYGKVYRTGGDEFISIVYAPEDKFHKMIEDFEEEVASWHGSLVDSLTISFGYVMAGEFKGTGSTIHDVSVLADKRMYQSKTAFYKTKGVDRRGQFEAHVALCDLYTKILKINVTEDTYQIINMDETEKDADKGFAPKISEWFIGFGKSGYVHPDDLDNYLAEVDLGYISQYFKKDKTSHSFFYRRKYGDIYKKVMMEMIPAGDYSDDNQTLFLYVKNIDK